MSLIQRSARFALFIKSHVFFNLPVRIWRFQRRQIIELSFIFRYCMISCSCICIIKTHISENGKKENRKKSIFINDDDHFQQFSYSPASRILRVRCEFVYSISASKFSFFFIFTFFIRKIVMCDTWRRRLPKKISSFYLFNVIVAVLWKTMLDQLSSQLCHHRKYTNILYMQGVYIHNIEERSTKNRQRNKQ